MKLKKIKQAYNNAIKLNQETFFVDGMEFLVSYVKYLIQYLEMQGLKNNDEINFERK